MLVSSQKVVWLGVQPQQGEEGFCIVLLGVARSLTLLCILGLVECKVITRYSSKSNC